MSLDQIKLNLIDRSSDANNSDILIFQKNADTSFSGMNLAWKVVKNLGSNCHHPFTYSNKMEVSMQDAYGNYSQKLTAYPGNAFEVKKNHSGNVIQANGRSVSAEEVEVANNLPTGAITANIYRDGKLLAQKNNMVGGQKASFKFEPKLYLMVASQIDEGDVIDSAILSQKVTEISLANVSSADIVLTGGGSGEGSEPFRFELENIKA